MPALMKFPIVPPDLNEFRDLDRPLSLLPLLPGLDSKVGGKGGVVGLAKSGPVRELHVTGQWPRPIGFFKPL